MKRIILYTCFMALFLPVKAQTGWGTLTPHASAALDISSENKGVLMPRIPTHIRTSIPAAKGLLVFDTDTNTYWYYNGTVWVELVYNFDSGTIGMIAAFASTIVPSNWRVLDGTGIPTADFPELSAVYPAWVSGATINLPDYRGYFLRGTGTNANGVTGAAIEQNQAASTALPVSPFVTNSTGGNAHTGTVTNSAGAHTHNYGDWGGASTNVAESALANNIADDLPAIRNTGAASAQHTHALATIATAGAHTHTITGGGDAQTQPRNISIVWAIKVSQ